MRLIVFSHKLCWRSETSPSGYATDGGFAFQMRAISQLFTETVIAVPVSRNANPQGEIALEGANLRVWPLAVPSGKGLTRKLAMVLWTLQHLPQLTHSVRKADAVHAPIPGDIGTIGMMLAWMFRKPLFVRYCNNWAVQRTLAERFWHWSLERTTGGRNVTLITGGAQWSPSAANPNLQWIFATTLTEQEIAACRREPAWRPGDPIRLVIACRQENGKGSDIVIHAVAQLLARGVPVTLDIAGDGSALPALRGLADSLGIGAAVRFHGKLHHDAVIALLRTGTLFCFPTAAEGFPKAVLEAMACGLPVVCTPVSVLPLLLAKGGGALIVEPSTSALLAGIEECLASAETYAERSNAAMATAGEYSLEAWRDTIGSILEEAWGPFVAFRAATGTSRPAISQ